MVRDTKISSGSLSNICGGDSSRVPFFLLRRRLIHRDCCRDRTTFRDPWGRIFQIICYGPDQEVENPDKLKFLTWYIWNGGYVFKRKCRSTFEDVLCLLKGKIKMMNSFYQKNYFTYIRTWKLSKSTEVTTRTRLNSQMVLETERCRHFTSVEIHRIRISRSRLYYFMVFDPPNLLLLNKKV